MIKKLYPQGKPKAFVVTYDDGVLQDRPFVALLNRYGLKGTFNLNSGLMESEFEWTHENGSVIKRLSAKSAASLYQGHEIAGHSLTHPYMEHLNEEKLMAEMQTDKANLERLFGREVKGFAVPFDYYSQRIEHCARECGFEYVRLPKESRSFLPPEDTFNRMAGIFHLDTGLTDFVDTFLSVSDELAFCQIAGHSYDLDTENMWDVMEDIFRKISADSNVLSMTTIELIGYLRAMRGAEITDSRIQNNSGVGLWFQTDVGICEIEPGQGIDL